MTRAAEWRRCGPQGGAFSGGSNDWPRHFLLLRRDSLPNSPLIFSFSNATSEAAGPLFAAGKSLWYSTSIYRDGDANCCPTSGVSLWVEARPRGGRFETGLVLRVREDSNQVVIGADTLHR